MFSTPDDVFCGHCGERLPAHGAKLGFCPDCARRFHRVIDCRPQVSRRPATIASFTQADDFSKDPLLATILSAICPGGGQVYNGHLFKAFLVFVTSPFVIPWLIGIVDAFFSARRHNSKREVRGAVPV